MHSLNVCFLGKPISHDIVSTTQTETTSMSSHPRITFFDIGCTLRTYILTLRKCYYNAPPHFRFVLNYKNLPYGAQWVHFPNIKNSLRSANVPPSRPEPPLYTVSAVIDRRPDGTPEAVSDTLLILNYVEQHHPSPSLFPGDIKKK